MRINERILLDVLKLVKLGEAVYSDFIRCTSWWCEKILSLAVFLVF